MTIAYNIRSLIFLLLISSFVVCAPPGTGEDDDKDKDDADSSEEESSKKDLGTISPSEMEILKEKIEENQDENAEKFDLPLTNSPEEIETFLKKEEKEYGKDLPEKVEENIADSGELGNLVHFIALYEKIKIEASDDEDYENIETKSPAEMKEMKEEIFELANQRNEKSGIPKISQEDFDKFWEKEKEMAGKKFVRLMKITIVELQVSEKIEEAIEEATPIPETVPETSSHETEPAEEESDVYELKNDKGKICILAKFRSEITETYTKKSSKQVVRMPIPAAANVNGKCAGPDESPVLQLSWKKFSFNLLFDKTSEDNWFVSLVEFIYYTDEMFDEVDKSVKITSKSKKEGLFETPMGKSYFCPAKEVIPLYSDDMQIGHVVLEDVHLQPYDVEDGKFSTIHRCIKVVILSLGEEAFQDETIPLAVGCTLALITLLILVGFSVHRAYMAAKVDYNNIDA